MHIREPCGADEEIDITMYKVVEKMRSIMSGGQVKLD